MKKQIKNGIYLVIDPSMEQEQLLSKLAAALAQEIAAVQVWDHWKDEEQQKQLIPVICELCAEADVPVLINNDWSLLLHHPIDGVHFDTIPNEIDMIRKKIGRDFIAGVTINNDLIIVQQAENNQLDYISFCSVFPSSTSNSCELVSFDTIRKARTLTSIPVFLAGGIRPETIAQLSELEFNGVAVISGIMNAADAAQATKHFNQLLKIKQDEIKYNR